MDWRIVNKIGKIDDAIQKIPKNTNISVVSILNWIYALMGLLTAGYIVFGAVKYVLSQGDPGKIKEASQAITYAVVGLIVVLVAAGITNFIAGGVL